MAYVFDLMQKQIINRSLNTCLTIFKGLDVRGGIQQAPFALEVMRKEGFVLNVYSYNGLIYNLIQSGYCREALEVDERVVSEGINPSLKTYSTLMVALGKRRDVKTVMSLLNEMECLGLRPNVYTFTVCIRVLGRVGKIDEACEIFKRMDDEGCDPDVITYILFMDYYGKCGDSGKAIEALEKMKNKGIVPNIVACNASLYSLAEEGGLQEALDVYNELEYSSGLSPDSVTYNTMMKCYIKVGQIDEAIEFLSEIEGNGCEADVIVAISLIDMLYKADRVDEHGKCFTHGTQLFSSVCGFLSNFCLNPAGFHGVLPNCSR